MNGAGTLRVQRMTLWELDRDLFRFIHTAFQGSDAWKWVIIAITSMGLGQVQLVGLGLFALKREWRNIAYMCIWAGALSGLLRLVVMKFADRQRPSNFDFAQPLEQVFGRSSFPSGHTTTSFAIAFMLWLLLVEKNPPRWVVPTVLAWALVVSLSRIAAGMHYPLDIVGGICMGAFGAGLSYLLAQRFGWIPRNEN